MELRPELQFPKLPETKIQSLAKLASAIDGARPGEWEEELAEFNELAGASLEFNDFQGISGGMEHDSWVRNTLCLPLAQKPLKLTHEEMLELISRLCIAAGQEHEQFFWLKILETNLDPRISDLIHWPGEYFGDNDHSRKMSPRNSGNGAEFQRLTRGRKSCLTKGRKAAPRMWPFVVEPRVYNSTSPGVNCLQYVSGFETVHPGLCLLFP